MAETSGPAEIESGRRIVVDSDRRSHKPILNEAQLDRDSLKILWPAGHRLTFHYAQPESTVSFIAFPAR